MAFGDFGPGKNVEQGSSFAFGLLDAGPVASCPSRQCSRDLPACALSGSLPLAPPVLSGAKLVQGLEASGEEEICLRVKSLRVMG